MQQSQAMTQTTEVCLFLDHNLENYRCVFHRWGTQSFATKPSSPERVGDQISCNTRLWCHVCGENFWHFQQSKIIWRATYISWFSEVVNMSVLLTFIFAGLQFNPILSAFYKKWLGGVGHCFAWHVWVSLVFISIFKQKNLYIVGCVQCIWDLTAYFLLPELK